MEPTRGRVSSRCRLEAKSMRFAGGASGPAGPVNSTESERSTRNECGCQQFAKKPHAPDDRQHGRAIAECGDLARVKAT